MSGIIYKVYALATRTLPDEVLGSRWTTLPAHLNQGVGSFGTVGTWTFQCWLLLSLPWLRLLILGLSISLSDLSNDV